MKKVEDIYNQVFDNLSVDSNICDRSLNNIKKKYVRHKFTKKICFSICSICVVFITFFGIAYAEEIDQIIKSIFSIKDVYVDDNGNSHNINKLMSTDKIEINKDLKFDDKYCRSTRGFRGPLRDTDICDFYSDSEIEKMFNINLIKSNLDIKKEFYLLNVNRNDSDNITGITFQKSDIYNDYETENLNVPLIRTWLFIRTTDNDNDLITIIDENQFNDYKQIYIKSLNTEGYIISGKYMRRLYVVYDKVSYVFDFYSRGRNVDDLDEEVSKLIQSFEV